MSNGLVSDPIALLGARTRAVRRERGLTQAQLAVAAQVSRSFVNELENGHARAELGKVIDVLQALGLQLATVPYTPSATELVSQARAEALADVFKQPATGKPVTDEATRQVVQQYIAGQMSIDDAIDAISSLSDNEPR